MLSNINNNKILKNVINNSRTTTIIDISSTSDEFISKAINFSKSNSLFIHAINSDPQNKNYKDIKYDGFTYSNIILGNKINKDQNIYTLDFIFSSLKWAKIDLLRIDGNKLDAIMIEGATNIFSKEIVNVTIIENAIKFFKDKKDSKKLFEFTEKFKLNLYLIENAGIQPINIDNFNSFNLDNRSIAIVNKNYNLGLKLIHESFLKNLAFKKMAVFFGKLPFFRGQDRIVRYFYPPNKFNNLDKGENFTTQYFGVKYKGITSNYIDWGVYFKGGHEKGLINFLKKKISKFDVFFDIGANSGTLSLPFIFENKLDILCFEPLTYSYNKLRENFKINNAPSRHKLFKIALSNKKGMSKIYFSKTNENTGFASIDNYFKHQNMSIEEIKLNTVDELFKIKNKKIIFKIDVEGYEKKVIEGALETLQNNKVLMYIESRDKSVIENLKEKGFKTSYFIFKGDKIKFLKNKQTQDVLMSNFII